MPHQRLPDEHGLSANGGTFYRYVWRHSPDRGPPPHVTIRLDDPPPGEEAQVSFLYTGRWCDPDH